MKNDLDSLHSLNRKKSDVISESRPLDSEARRGSMRGQRFDLGSQLDLERELLRIQGESQMKWLQTRFQQFWMR